MARSRASRTSSGCCSATRRPMGMIGPSDAPVIRERHIIDSLRGLPHLPTGGAGSGPGLGRRPARHPARDLPARPPIRARRSEEEPCAVPDVRRRAAAARQRVGVRPAPRDADGASSTSAPPAPSRRPRRPGKPRPGAACHRCRRLLGRGRASMPPADLPIGVSSRAFRGPRSCAVGSAGYHGPAVTKASAGAGAAQSTSTRSSSRGGSSTAPRAKPSSRAQQQETGPEPAGHARHRPGDRDREPEGRRRQEHHRRQPRRGPRGARLPGPRDRPGSAGQRLDGPGHPTRGARHHRLRRHRLRGVGRRCHRQDGDPPPLRAPLDDRPGRRRDRAREPVLARNPAEEGACLGARRRLRLHPARLPSVARACSRSTP